MSLNNIRLICRASSRSYMSGRHGSSTHYSPARVAIEGVIWTSPTPSDGYECAYINESVDMMIGNIKTANPDQPQCLSE